MNKVSAQPGIEAALRLVVEGTVSETGAEFFRALVKNVASALGTLGAWVTEYLPEERKLRALALWMKGDFVERFEYSIPGTACQSVVEKRTLIHIPERLIELYPRDDDLVPLSAVSPSRVRRCRVGHPVSAWPEGHSRVENVPRPVAPRVSGAQFSVRFA